LEIMLVVVIIGILIALVGPNLGNRAQTARIQATNAQMRNIATALKNFELENAIYPASLGDLIEAPTEHERTWSGPYLDADAVPLDAWGEEFIYRFPGENNRLGFDLWSKGPDRQDGTEDDITNWTQGK